MKNLRNKIVLGVGGIFLLTSLGCALPGTSRNVMTAGPRITNIGKDLRQEGIYKDVCDSIKGNAINLYYNVLIPELEGNQKNGRYLNLNPEAYYFQVWKPNYLKNRKKPAQESRAY